MAESGTVITKLFYITTGRKNGFYTLRTQNLFPAAAMSAFEVPDNHVCTLAANEDAAIQKAKAYVEAFRARVPETEHFKIQFDPELQREVYQRRGNLSVNDTIQLEEVERGVMPFGKNKGKIIADLPATSILWYADQSNKSQRPVMSAICDLCAGIAAEKGYLNQREEERTRQMEQYALSCHVGELKSRLTFNGVLISIFQAGDYFNGSDYVPPYFIQTFQCGNDLIVYKGAKQLCEKGETITFKGTVKAHDVWKGAKTTVVNRPSLLKE